MKTLITGSMKTAAIVVMTVVAGYTATCQNFNDAGGTGFRYYLPSVSATNGLQMTGTDFNAFFNARIYKGKKTAIAGGFKAFQVGLRAMDNQRFESLNLYSIQANLTLMQVLGQKTRLLIQLAPQINSDFASAGMGDIRVPGSVIVKTQVNGKFGYSLGVNYNSQINFARVLPLIGVNWKISDRDYLNMLLPGSFRLEHRFGDRFYLATEALARSMSFAIGGQDHALSMGGNRRKAGFYVETLLLAEYEVMKNICVFGGFGLAHARKFEQYDAQDNLVSIENSSIPQGDLNNSKVVKVGLVLRVRS